MAYTVSRQVITFPLSGTVSEPLAFRSGDLVAVWVPTVTSGSFTLQGAFVTNAASVDYVPIHNAPPNSGPFTLWWGPGSLSCALHTTLAPFSAVRFVSSVPQASVRSLVAVFKT